MKIAIIGAGAIGGLVGVKLALAGEDVTFMVRGANLAAIQSNGMKLQQHDGTELVARNVRATNNYDEAGPQDVVILALKAQQVEAVIADLPKLFGEQTTVITMQNGIPVWYFQKHGGEHDGRGVTSVDPTGLLSAGIPAERVIGCVVYPASELIAPGVVRHIEGDRFPLGELDGSVSERVLTRAGNSQFAFANADITDVLAMPSLENYSFGKIEANGNTALTATGCSAFTSNAVVRREFIRIRNMAGDSRKDFCWFRNRLAMTAPNTEPS